MIDRRRAVMAACGAALVAACGPATVWTPPLEPAWEQAEVWTGIAVRRAEDAARPSDEEIDVHARLADALLDERRYEDALDHVGFVCAARPGLYTCRRLEARSLLYGRSDLEGALAAADACIALNDHVYDCHLIRGLSLADLGRPAEAVDALESAWALRPRAADPAEPLARALMALERWDEAVAATERALDAEPWSVPVRLLRAHVLERAGQLDAAEAEYRRLLPLHHQPTTSLRYLQMFYQRQGRADDAAAIEREIRAVEGRR